MKKFGKLKRVGGRTKNTTTNRDTFPSRAPENASDPTPIDVPDISMYEMIKLSASKHPEAIACDYMGSAYSYADLIRKIDVCALALGELGVGAGEAVTVCMPNTPEAIICIYALNKIGAAANIIHPLSAEREIQGYVNSVGSTVLLAIDLCRKKIANIIDETSLQTVILVSASDSMPLVLKLGYKLTAGVKRTPEPGDRRFITWKEFAAKGAGKGFKPAARLSNDLPAIILHSGGTTGVPKEIMLSNRCFNALGVQGVMTLPDISVGDSVLAILPIFHGFGLGVCVHVTLCFGARSVLVPRFESQKFGKLLAKYRPTMVFGVPTLYEALINTPNIGKLDLSFFKYVVSGGDSLSPPLERKINRFLAAHGARVKISQGYGMTESLAAVCLAVRDAYKPESIGKPLAGNNFCIVAPGTQDILPPNEDGEICVSGPTVMLGYRNDERETNEALQIHSDGRLWLHTGDIGCIDSEGFIFYKLRLKRMIISSGYNIYPQHIEKVVEEHRAVLKCTVIGVPDPYKMEVAKAYVVLKNGFEETETVRDSIRRHCEKNLARYCIPHEFEFRRAIPQTRLGKTDFSRLRREHLEKTQNGENGNEKG